MVLVRWWKSLDDRFSMRCYSWCLYTDVQTCLVCIFVHGFPMLLFKIRGFLYAISNVFCLGWIWRNFLCLIIVSLFVCFCVFVFIFGEICYANYLVREYHGEDLTHLSIREYRFPTDDQFYWPTVVGASVGTGVSVCLGKEAETADTPLISLLLLHLLLFFVFFMFYWMWFYCFLSSIIK